MNTIAETEENVTAVVPFLSVLSMERSVAYYVDGLGFQIRHKWEQDGKLRWCWLALGGAAIMLQEFATQSPHTLPPGAKPGAGVSFYFICRDAVAIYRNLRSRDIQTTEPEVLNSMWVTGLFDPDGYHLFFESPTDIPEHTKLTEKTMHL